VDARSDIFSLGCVLYEMLAGRRAFACPTMSETLAAIVSAPAPELSASGTDAPPDLGRVVARCLENSRESVSSPRMIWRSLSGR